MSTALVVTQRVGDGLSTATAYRPKIGDDYVLDGYQDLTGQRHQPTSIAVMVVQIDVPDLTLPLIQADPQHFVLLAPGDSIKPTKAQALALRTWLLARGITSQQFLDWLGASPENLTRAQIVDVLRAQLRQLAS